MNRKADPYPREQHDSMLTNADQAGIAEMILADLRESPRARALAQSVVDMDWEEAFNKRDEEYWTLDEQHDAVAKAYDGLREAMLRLLDDKEKANVDGGHDVLLDDLRDILAEFKPRAEIET